MSTALNFVEPPPGFAPLVDFSLDDVDGAPGLHTLRAAANPDIRLFVLDAPVYLPDYAPTFSEENYRAVGAGGPDDAAVMVVATLSGGAPVVNLMAPLLVNSTTGAASQVILDGEDWPLRAQLLPPGTAA